MGTGQRDPAHAEQTGNAQGGKQFFQVLLLHSIFPRKFELKEIEKLNQYFFNYHFFLSYNFRTVN